MREKLRQSSSMCFNHRPTRKTLLLLVIMSIIITIMTLVLPIANKFHQDENTQTLLLDPSKIQPSGSFIWISNKGGLGHKLAILYLALRMQELFGHEIVVDKRYFHNGDHGMYPMFSMKESKMMHYGMRSPHYNVPSEFMLREGNNWIEFNGVENKINLLCEFKPSIISDIRFKSSIKYNGHCTETDLTVMHIRCGDINLIYSRSDFAKSDVIVTDLDACPRNTKDDIMASGKRVVSNLDEAISLLMCNNQLVGGSSLPLMLAKLHNFRVEASRPKEGCAGVYWSRNVLFS